MYFTEVENFVLRDVIISNITKSKDLLSHLRVIKIDALESLGPHDINNFKILNLSYTNSQMSFLDF
jgi:hypothetical protein